MWSESLRLFHKYPCPCLPASQHDSSLCLKKCTTNRLQQEKTGGKGGAGRGKGGESNEKRRTGSVFLLLLWTVCAARVLQCVPPVSSGAVPIFFVFFRRAHAEPASLASAFKVRQVHACPVASPQSCQGSVVCRLSPCSDQAWDSSCKDRS